MREPVPQPRPWHALLGAVLTGALLLAGPAAASQSLDRIVAVVNEDIILESELEQEVAAIRQQMQQANQSPPPQDELIDQVMERLVMERLQMAQARRIGIQVDENTLNAAVRQVAQQNNMTVQQLRNALSQQGIDFESFREDLRDDIIIQRLHQQRVQRSVDISEREIESFLAEQEADADDVEYRLSHILVSVPESPTPEEIDAAREEAEQALERVRRGDEAFATVAAAVSDAQDALEGGGLGWRKPGELPTIFQEEVATMDEGDVAGPIRSTSGFHLVRVDEIRRADVEMVEQTRARHILIQTSEVVSDADARTRLEGLRDRIEQGESFEELARAHSDDQGSASAGGDLEWLSPGQVVPEFEEVMENLPPGEISQPFQTQYGWHLVKVEDRREHDSTEERRRARAVQQIRERKADEAIEQWLRELRDDAYVEMRLDS